MTSRQRVLDALSFKPTDRLPKDLGGMRSTGVSAFAYQSLRNALGLPFKPTLVHDTWQMLAAPHVDVLDALGCDVVFVEADGVTNAFDQPERWKPYDFNGRIPHAMVQDPTGYRVDVEGTIHRGETKMPVGAHVFDEEGAGQLLVMDGDMPRPDLAKVEAWLETRRMTPEKVDRLADTCRRIRRESDRAVFLWGACNLELCIHGYGGVAVFPVLCLEDPDFVKRLHEMHLELALFNCRSLLPAVRDCVDVIGVDADDWGNQQSLMASPATFRDLFLPYRKRHCAEIRKLAPKSRTFLHSCGAILPLMDMLVDAGIDALNPVQWPAGGKTPAEWKARTGNALALWGGGVNSQHTLPSGSIADVEAEVARTVPALARGGGYVFANIHNFLAEVSAEKIVAMFRAADHAGFAALNA
jgi:uroporphyrinogen decarboxylase